MDSQDILHINGLIVGQHALGIFLGVRLSINGKMACIQSIISSEEQARLKGSDYFLFMGEMWGRAFNAFLEREEHDG